MRRFLSFLALSLGVSVFVTSCKKPESTSSTSSSTSDRAVSSTSTDTGEIKLFEAVDERGAAVRGAAAARATAALRIIPGSQAEADAYYNEVRKALTNFPQATLQQSSIGDMLVYYGYPSILPKDVESLAPAVLMDFSQLRKSVTNIPDFEAAYKADPLKAGEIVSVRFFAPKIINVRDAQVDGVPVLGFGWRKIVRFRSRAASKARADGLDTFYLLFNFTTTDPKFPPPEAHAGQIQTILQPIYPSGGKHRDIYFLVYEGLGSDNPEKVGFFLKATFDLAGVVDDKYFVPRSCGQCHGTTAADQKRGKVNYLDTDHWIDRTGDDFKKVQANDVIVDGPPAYATFRSLNTEIEAQNAAVVDGGPQFALLAARKWLELHKIGGADETRHVPPLRRGFFQTTGDPVWTDGASPDTELLPELNQYCFRCHSSVIYHVFEKKAVMDRKSSIVRKLNSGSMPQDRVLNDATKQRLIDHVNRLP